MTYIYETKDGHPTGKLLKIKDIKKHKRGKHDWVVAADSQGNEVFIYYDACGIKRD